MSYFVSSGDCYFLSTCDSVDKEVGRADVYAQRGCSVDGSGG